MLLDKAPEFAIAIGDPTLTVEDAPLLRRPELARLVKDQATGFSITSYETGRFVLPSALESALAAGAGPSDVIQLRDQIRIALDKGVFDSLSPDRQITFRDGNLADPPPTHVYRIQRSFARLDSTRAARSVALGFPEHTRFLEEPVTVTLEGSGTEEGEEIRLDVFADRLGKTTIVEEGSVKLQGNKGVYTFYPNRTGVFRISTNLRSMPNDAVVSVEWTWNYVWGALAALVGALIGTGSLGPGVRAWPRIAIGTQ